MNVNIHNTIKNEYDRRQKAAHDDLMSRRSEVYSQLPRIWEIDNQIQLSGIKYNKLILLGNTPADMALSELIAEIDGLKQEKQRLLAQNGYPENYMDIIFQCPYCKDTGYIDGKNGAERCSCYKQQLIGYLYSQSNIKLIEIENFSTFNSKFYPDVVDMEKYGIPLSPRENILRIRERCQKFIENFDSSDERNLFFSGPAGVGKTFLSNCIAKELLDKGKTVLYQTAPVLFDTISEYKMKVFREEEYEDEGYRKIFDVELLVIDDLGTESPSSARYAELLNILNTRQINNMSRPCKTIISTNIDIRELYEYYKERVASRIVGCFDMFKFAGDDIRRLKKLNAK